VSLDKSLKVKSKLKKIRSVLNRIERLEVMKANDKWDDSMSPFGIPKTKIIRVTIGKKKKEKKAEEGDDKDAKKGGKAAKPAAGAAAKAPAAAAAPAKKK